jgi:rhamnosyltransferase
MIFFFSVLYNPQENAIKNIVLAKSAGFIPIVYLNSVNEDYLNELKDLEVITLGDNSNVGLGRAFNDVETYFTLHSIEHFIFFDQDTIVEKSGWNYIKSTYLNLFQDDVGMLYFNSHISSDDLNVVINSGCAFSLKVLSVTGYHDHFYFVEGVDYEFCLRLKAHGYKIKSVLLNAIDHSTLQDKTEKIFLGKKIDIRCYGSRRLRVFTKSHLRLIKKAIKLRQYKLLFFFIKSFIVFNLNELFNRFLMVIL